MPPARARSKNSSPLHSPAALATEAQPAPRGPCLSGLRCKSIFYLDDDQKDRLRLLSRHSRKSSDHSGILFKGTAVEQPKSTLQTTASPSPIKRINSALSTLTKTTAPASVSFFNYPKQPLPNSSVMLKTCMLSSPYFRNLFSPAGKMALPSPPFYTTSPASITSNRQHTRPLEILKERPQARLFRRPRP